ncbi:hypothetical protein COCC4DRAFT_65401 [Bipolaris maydis ATCC 48331]|uniref:Uncharacterized protein n=2 Tax=Cochliobolus heterostrophus TaxID=5016 RepID=M2U9P8_COCH5|nr:uncharacterized protein COCC4DRAFT_65401 [Bipolaris maydis ATCC 48331]EMD95304.1 hypothetical protein COCHEDRAFT_1091865 [Bipolaris maydis C5]KAH7556173.1 hypothetical protein BM1_06699 [Bipolaris maydis]ENI00452.1 hypothetical protein COCC4DRAFT_65401 [Bipolaris maydis ATCC 48331]KAJ5021916.1 hypothetical protein J3E73DRAFT_374903 [Bipolaris maydis]KAJ5035244.1 hypothetical protein J3E74DRAFT_413614 [Bipolaris maydis]
MEVDMAGTAVPVDWPTLLWRQQGEAQDTSNIDHNRNSSWTMPTASPIRNCGTSMQPDLYLQLSHILEWEIWNHNQTRGYLATERDKVSELNAQVWRLSRDIEQWRNTCQQGYAALDQHRAENVELKRALAEARSIPTEPHSKDPPLGTPEMATPPQRCSLRKLAPLPRIETDESSWRLGFIKDIEEHGIAKSVE